MSNAMAFIMLHVLWYYGIHCLLEHVDSKSQYSISNYLEENNPTTCEYVSDAMLN
jgi:hypothetical protein